MSMCNTQGIGDSVTHCRVYTSTWTIKQFECVSKQSRRCKADAMLTTWHPESYDWSFPLVSVGKILVKTPMLCHHPSITKSSTQVSGEQVLADRDKNNSFSEITRDLCDEGLYTSTRSMDLYLSSAGSLVHPGMSSVRSCLPLPVVVLVRFFSCLELL